MKIQWQSLNYFNKYFKIMLGIIPWRWECERDSNKWCRNSEGRGSKGDYHFNFPYIWKFKALQTFDENSSTLCVHVHVFRMPLKEEWRFMQSVQYLVKVAMDTLPSNCTISSTFVRTVNHRATELDWRNCGKLNRKIIILVKLNTALVGLW